MKQKDIYDEIAEAVGSKMGDKAGIAGQRMKTSYAKTKQRAVESYSSDDNPVEYASGRISDTASRVLNKGTDGAVSAGHQSAKAAQAAAVKLRWQICAYH